MSRSSRSRSKRRNLSRRFALPTKLCSGAERHEQNGLQNSRSAAPIFMQCLSKGAYAVDVDEVEQAEDHGVDGGEAKAEADADAEAEAEAEAEADAKEEEGKEEVVVDVEAEPQAEVEAEQAKEAKEAEEPDQKQNDNKDEKSPVQKEAVKRTVQSVSAATPSAYEHRAIFLCYSPGFHAGEG